MKLKQLFCAFIALLSVGCYSIQGQNYNYDEKIYQDTGTRGANFGPLQGFPIHVAHYFPASQLEQYDGMLLHQVEFFVFATPVSLEVKVYGEGTSSSPGELLFSKVVDPTGIVEEWVVVDLDVPIEIGGEDLWIGYEVENEYGSGSVGTDPGPANTGFGDWYSEDGVEWEAFNEQRSWFNRNWNIKGHLKAPVIHQNDVYVRSIPSPQTGIDLTSEEEIIIEIKNYGFQTQNEIPYTVNWLDQQYDGVYTGSLATEESVNITLPVTADFSEYGMYTIEACTNLPGDERPELDCAEKEVENRRPTACTDELYYIGCSSDRISYWNLADVEISEISCPSDGTAFHNMRGSLHHFVPGETYELTVKSTQGDHHFALWIDYNNDLELTPDEMILADGYCEVGDEEYTFSITIPETVEPGEFLMRMRSQNGAPVEDPCAPYFIGITIDFTAVFSDIVGVNDWNYENITVYPNPFSDEIHIGLPQSIDTEVNFSIADITGKILYNGSQKHNGQSLNIDSAFLSSGIYFLSIEGENISAVKKIIKK